MSRVREYAFDWIAWGLLAGLPAIIFWQSATSLAGQGAASGGAMQNAALFPRMVAAAMTVLLAWHAVRLATGRVSRPSPLRRQEGTGLALLVAGLFALYLAALPVAGFHLATPLLSALLFRLLGIRTLVAIAGGVGLSLALSYVFEGLLNVVLPVGALNLTVFD